MIISKTSDKCLKCKHRDYCDEKRMVACALAENIKLIPNNFAQPIMNPIVNPVMRDTSVRAQINEQIEKDFEKEFYKRYNFDCHFKKGDA